MLLLPHLSKYLCPLAIDLDAPVLRCRTKTRALQLTGLEQVLEKKSIAIMELLLHYSDLSMKLLGSI